MRNEESGDDESLLLPCVVDGSLLARTDLQVRGWLPVCIRVCGRLWAEAYPNACDVCARVCGGGGGGRGASVRTVVTALARRCRTSTRCWRH